jgi:hypothetical protein
MEVEKLFRRNARIWTLFRHVSAGPRHGNNRAEPPTAIDSPESDLAHPSPTTPSPKVVVALCVQIWVGIGVNGLFRKVR